MHNKYYTDGITLFETNHYVNGKLHGQSKSYYYNGKLWKDSHYVDGDQQGKFLEYYENG